MNKFTLILEDESKKPTAQQELETAWVEFNGSKSDSDLLLPKNTYEFYYEMRNKNFDAEVILEFITSKGANS